MKYIHLFIAILPLFANAAQTARSDTHPDIVIYSGVPCGIAAAMTAKDYNAIQQLNVTALQEKLRSQNQVVDFHLWPA